MPDLPPWSYRWFSVHVKMQDDFLIDEIVQWETCVHVPDWYPSLLSLLPVAGSEYACQNARWFLFLLNLSVRE